MKHQDNDQGQYRIAIFSEVVDPAELHRIFSERLSVKTGNSKSWLIHVPGILNETFSKEQATELAEAINAAGLNSKAVCRNQIPDLNHAISIIDVSCGEDGLKFSDFNQRHAGQVPWSAVEMICVGEVQPSRIDDSSEDESVSKAGDHDISPHPDSREHELELLISCQLPFPDLRVHHKRLKHEYLALRRAAWTKIDFRTFLNEVIRHATQALLPQSTQDYLRHVRHGRQYFSSFDEWMRYATLQAVLAKTMAKETSQPEVRSAGSGPSNLRKPDFRELDFGDLNCGDLDLSAD